MNVPSAEHVVIADYLGIASGRRADKFAKTKLTPVRSELVDAPYVAEFPVIIECKLRHILEIGLHTEFVGEVLDIKVDEDKLTPSGHADVEKVAPFVFMDGYRAIGEYLGKPFSIGRRL